MKRLDGILLLFSLFWILPSGYAQLEKSHWRFGTTARGLHFSPTGTVSVTTTSYLPHGNEGCSVLSDPSTGDLKFYTDGMRVVDADDQLMPNGDGLIGHSSSMCSGKIALDPSNCNRYYIFHTPSAYEAGTGNLYYTLVDMTLPGNGTAANPKGDVVAGQKNIEIATDISEGIEVVPLAENHGFWLLFPLNSNNSISIYKFTSTGFTQTGSYPLNSTLVDMRPVEFCKVNGKVALASLNDSDNVLILDFNTKTGSFSNETIIPGIPKTNGRYYGTGSLCWSPDGTKLYISKYRNGSSGGKLYQYDLNTGTTELMYDVNGSDITITARGLKLGPDNKIYFLYGSGTADIIGAINDPNNPAGTCNFNPNQVNMGGSLAGCGRFPDFLYTCNSLKKYTDSLIVIQRNCNSPAALDTLIHLGLNTKDSDDDLLNYTIVKKSLSTSTVSLAQDGISYKNTILPPYTDTILISYCDDFCRSMCDTLQVVVKVTETAAGTLNLHPVIATCGNLPIALDAGPGMSSYTWSTGATTQSITVNTSGVYTIIATDANGCSYRDTTEVIVRPLPTVNLGTDTTACDSLVLNVTAYPSIKWNTGSTATSIIAKTSGIYIVEVKDAFGCAAADTIHVAIRSHPVIDIGGPYLFCGNQPINLTLSVTGMTTVLWSTGSTANSIVVTTPNTYSVKVTDNYGCKGFDETTVAKYPVPAPAFVFTNAACENALVSFTDQSTISSGSISKLVWNFGDSSPVAFGQLASHAYQQAGTYMVKLTVTSDLGCHDSLSKQLTIYDNPDADFSYTTMCTETSISLTDKSVSTDQITSWTWDFGDGKQSVQQHTPHIYITKGNYTVSLTVKTDKGCMGKIYQPVSIHTPLIVKFGAKGVCEGTASPFTNLSQVDDSVTCSFLWDFGDGSPVQNAFQPSHLYASPGYFQVKLVVKTPYLCTDSVIKQVYVNPNPEPDFEATPVKGCTPLAVSFSDLSTSASGKIIKWAWDLGNGKSDLKNPSTVFLNPGKTTLNYTIALKVTTDSGCVAQTSKPDFIQVYPKPKTDFSVSPKVTSINTPLVSLVNNSSGTDSVWWDFGDKKTSSVFNVFSHVYTESGTYVVKLISFSPYGCKDSTEHEVIIQPYFTFYIPNAFTPNDDGDNDTFAGKGVNIKEYEMIIFNRWGNVMFTTTNLNEPWNGSKNGNREIAANDTYVYLIHITDMNMKKHAYRGTVTLVR